MGSLCSKGTEENASDEESQQSFQFNVTRPTAFGPRKTKGALKKEGSKITPVDEDEQMNVKKVSTCSILSKKDRGNELGAESSATKVGKRKTNLSFNDCDEIRDYEKEAAIKEDGQLKKKSQFKRISNMDMTQEENNVNFKKLVQVASKTFNLS